MAVKRQSVAQTLAEVMSWRPVLEPVLKAFEPLLAAQEELAAPVAERLHAAGVEMPQAQPQRLEQGVSLLAGFAFAGVAPCVRLCAEKLLPLLGQMDTVAPHEAALSDIFLKQDAAFDQRCEQLMAAVAFGDKETFARVAEEHGLDPLVLQFAAGFVIPPVLRAMTAGATPEEGEAPWDQGDVWRQGYCPVCGALPSIGWLDKPQIDEKNAFLAGGGGKKHLHCDICGADWKFRRGACPSCGEEGSGVMEFLRESGTAHGERLDWCTKCKSYCPSVDLREREFVPNLDALALGMMHLDMVAARKKLRPLRPTFWNVF